MLCACLNQNTRALLLPFFVFLTQRDMCKTRNLQHKHNMRREKRKKHGKIGESSKIERMLGCAFVESAGPPLALPPRPPGSAEVEVLVDSRSSGLARLLVLRRRPLYYCCCSSLESCRRRRRVFFYNTSLRYCVH